MGCCKIHATLAHRGANKKHVNVCHDLQEDLGNDPSVSHKVVTGEESWCYSYDPESKQQSNQRKSPNSTRPKRAQQVHSSVKKNLIYFFDVEGIVHREFFPLGPTVNQQFYLNVLK